MSKVYLISCVKTKRDVPCESGDLYTSALFQKARKVAELEGDKWFILSAKYGLLSPEEIVNPYNETLINMSKSERLEWSKNVYKKLISRIEKKDEIIFLAGEKYREFLAKELNSESYKTYAPMANLSIGNQLKWLNSRIKKHTVEKDLDTFYKLLTKLEEGLGSG
jgi:hypothetical protein